MALGRKRTLSKTSLVSSREAVGVPTSPGNQMGLPLMVMCVRLGSFFFGAEFSNHFGVSDLFAAVGRDVFEVDEEEGVHSFVKFAQAVGRGANALAEQAEFVGV